MRHVTGEPIKFVGVGEKLDGLEVFHPERMASRILGMGDVLSLVEEAQRDVDLDEAQKLAQEGQVRQGLRPRGLQGADRADAQDGRPRRHARQAAGASSRARRRRGAASTSKQIGRIEGIINSMTPAERAQARTPQGLAQAPHRRRRRRQVQEVNQLLNQFEQTQKMMKMVAKGGMQKMMRGMKGMLPGR